MGTAPIGKFFDKNQVLAQWDNGTLPQIESSSFDELKVQTTRDVVIATLLVTEKGRVVKRKYDLKLRYTCVLAKQNGTWQMLAAHGTVAGKN